MAEEKLNLIRKILRIRQEFTGLRIEKSGKGPKYSYFQLEDFMPKATELCSQYGVLPLISFTNELATMTIYDADSPDIFVITSPMSESKLLNCQPIQNTGSSETYSRRYLWMVFLELIVPDVLDANQVPDNGGYQNYQNGYQPRPAAQRPTVQPQNAPQADTRPAVAPAQPAQGFDPKKVWNEVAMFYGYDNTKAPTDPDNADALAAAHELFDPYAKNVADLTPEKGEAIRQRLRNLAAQKGPEDFQDDSAELGAS